MLTLQAKHSPTSFGLTSFDMVLSYWRINFSLECPMIASYISSYIKLTHGSHFLELPSSRFISLHFFKYFLFDFLYSLSYFHQIILSTPPLDHPTKPFQIIQKGIIPLLTPLERLKNQITSTHTQINFPIFTSLSQNRELSP